MNWPRWLYPGIRLKRWFLLMVLSLVILGVGFSGIMSQHTSGIHYNPPVIVQFSQHMLHLKFIDWLLMLLALFGVVLAVRRSIYTVLTILIPAREKEFVNIAYNRRGNGTAQRPLQSQALHQQPDGGGDRGRRWREFRPLEARFRHPAPGGYPQLHRGPVRPGNPFERSLPIPL
jgi:hypothetical protein